MPFPVPPEASRTFLCTPSLHDALPISSSRYPIQQRLLPRPTTFARRVPGLSLTSTPPDGKMGRPWIGRKERGVTEMNPRLMIVSKFLSKHLRHAPAELGLTCLGRVIP